MTLELKVPPVAVFLIAAVLMAMLRDAGSGFGASASFPDTAAPLSPTMLSLGAVVLGALGLVVALLGVREFRSARTTVDPRYPERSSRLVTSGIYQHTRNPMYLGMLLILAAIALGLRAAAPWALLPLFVLYMNRFQIRPEERAMAGMFGATYAEYRARVRPWI